MRKALSTILLTLAVFFGQSQVILNEIYTNPGDGKHEFFELYNTSPQAVNLDCYTLVALCEQNSILGVYVIDLPNLSVDAKSYFMGAAANSINVQQKTNLTAAFSWNNFSTPATGSLKGYTINNNNTGYDPITIPSNFNNIFPELSNAVAGGVVYGVFLFNKDIYVNGLLAGYNKSVVPTKISSLPPLQITANSTCSAFTINWNNVKAAENVTEAGGNDNGYARVKDGICGTWNKTANGVSHTPGTINGNSSTTSSTLLSTTETYSCGPSIQFNIASSSSASAFPVKVHLYLDDIKIGVLDANDEYINPSQTINLGDNTSHSFTVPNLTKSYLLVYETALGCFDKIAALSCSILPVHFQSFTAARNQQRKEQVLLKWTTANEQNNRGFYVQRKVAGAWKNIAFVFSQADNGNSNTPLTYEYKEIHATNAVSQYQIQQVDLDGQTSYSDVKIVAGMNQASEVLLYPNPALSGKVNLLFKQTNSTKDVIVNDANGRVVKQFRQIADNTLTIEGLQSGFYTIKITDHATSTTTVEKVIVKQ
jgi:hypothetical protein